MKAGGTIQKIRIGNQWSASGKWDLLNGWWCLKSKRRPWAPSITNLWLDGRADEMQRGAA
jgi:hypothetical protein